MKADALDFDLPPELIAQHPTPQRSGSRLLHYRRGDRSISHRAFTDLPTLLRPGDLLVMNDARVTPARLMLVKPTGGRVEGLFLREPEPGRWRLLLKSLGRFEPGLRLAIEGAPTIALVLRAKLDAGEYEASIDPPATAALPLLDRVGTIPLPPYIQRPKAGRAGNGGGAAREVDPPADRQPAADSQPAAGDDAAPRSHLAVGGDAAAQSRSAVAAQSAADSHPAAGWHQMASQRASVDAAPASAFRSDETTQAAADRERYQTVYARSPGSVAAPTAGLHFDPPLLRALDGRGIERAFVTLHVGVGTFKPVTADDLQSHAMHAERYTISPDAADAINRAKRAGRRVVAIGTTAARVLESQPVGAEIAAQSDETRIFIYPPYTFRHINALVTNFHLPRSTLIALVAALIGLDEQRKVYAAAIAERYRFFSYGDACLIE